MREVYLESPDIPWTDIGGLEEVKRELQEAVEWPLRYPNLYKELGHTVPKGILLHGPLGTGKTMPGEKIQRHESIRIPHFESPLREFIFYL